ncbi:NUDIX domain-containing protein [Acidobacteria bacterium AH-259-D05]|nr:NUDIX domain-containing protein [Acidobacteria bacterium AH-259-D05]
MEQYKQIMGVMPILCVDAVIKNHDGEYLLVKRKNKPLKGEWWVIGGRVHKGETLEKAIIRKVKQELALDIKKLVPIGYHEDFFKENYFDLESGVHMVSVVFSTTIDDNQQIKLDCQSLDWKLSKELPPAFCIKSFDNC